MNANRIFFLIGGLVIVAVLALGWFLGVAPLLDEASASDAERQTVEAENTAQNAVLAQMKEQYAQLDELNLQLEELQLSVPALAQVEEFIDLTMRVAYASGTKVTSITISEGSLYGGNIVPGTVPPAEPASTDTGEPAAVVTSAALQPTAGLAANLYAIPITIVLENNPVKAAAFLKKIQRAQRLLLVNSVTLSSSPASSTVAGYLFVVSSGLPVIPVTPEPTGTPDPSATPTPTPTDGATPAPTGTPTPTPTAVPAS